MEWEKNTRKRANLKNCEIVCILLTVSEEGQEHRKKLTSGVRGLSQLHRAESTPSLSNCIKSSIFQWQHNEKNHKQTKQAVNSPKYYVVQLVLP